VTSGSSGSRDSSRARPPEDGSPGNKRKSANSSGPIRQWSKPQAMAASQPESKSQRLSLHSLQNAVLVCLVGYVAVVTFSSELLCHAYPPFTISRWLGEGSHRAVEARRTRSMSCRCSRRSPAARKVPVTERLSTEPTLSKWAPCSRIPPHLRVLPNQISTDRHPSRAMSRTRTP